jgi:hypothetical protein
MRIAGVAPALNRRLRADVVPALVDMVEDDDVIPDIDVAVATPYDGAAVMAAVSARPAHERAAIEAQVRAAIKMPTPLCSILQHGLADVCGKRSNDGVAWTRPSSSSRRKRASFLAADGAFFSSVDCSSSSVQETIHCFIECVCGCARRGAH